MRCGNELPLGLFSTLLTWGLLASTPSAQTPGNALQEGDTVIGVGHLTDVKPGVFNDQGMWIDLVDTDFPDLDRDFVLLRNGFVTLREGATLFTPAGAKIDEFRSYWMTNSGDLAMIMDMTGVPSANKTGAFWNTLPLAQLGLPFVSPQVPPGTTWQAFNVIKMNDSNTILMLGQIKRPPATRAEDCLIRFQVDSSGNLLSTDVLAVKNQIVPALGGDQINALGNTEHVISMNRHGDYITLVDPVVGGAAYLLNLNTVLAQESGPSPIPDRNWKTLTLLPKLSLNDFGEYAFSGALDGSTNAYLVVKNGEKFAQEGDALPALAPFVMGKGSSAPIYIANSGDVFWWVQASDGGANIDAYMRNDQVIVQQNRTVIEGIQVTKIESGESAFHVSPDGRFWLGKVDLQIIGHALIMVDFGLVVPVPGCLGNPGKLRVLDGRPLPGSRIRFSMDNGQALGVTPVLIFSQHAAIPGSDCGIPSAFGEVLINTASKIGRSFGPLWGGSPSIISVNIPPSLALVDMELFAQGFFWDVGDQTPAENFRLTNALRIEVGAP